MENFTTIGSKVAIWLVNLSLLQTCLAASYKSKTFLTLITNIFGDKSTDHAKLLLIW